VRGGGGLDVRVSARGGGGGTRGGVWVMREPPKLAGRGLVSSRDDSGREGGSYGSGTVKKRDSTEANRKTGKAVQKENKSSTMKKGGALG